MSIFGTSGIKFIYDHGGGSEATVIINHWVETRYAPETKYLVNESELNLERDMVKRGTHIVLEGIVYLYKYGLPEPLDYDLIKSKYDEIVQYHGELVSLWRHSDGVQFKTGTGADALFLLKDFVHYHLTTPDLKDAMILTFESVNVLNPVLGASQVIQPDEIVMDGGTIIE